MASVLFNDLGLGVGGIIRVPLKVGPDQRIEGVVP